MPVPRDPKSSNNYILKDANRLRDTFLADCEWNSSDPSSYSYDKATESNLSGTSQLGDYKKRMALWYQYYQNTYGDGASSVTPLKDYEEVQQYKAEIDAAIDAMNLLISEEVLAGGDINTLERYGDAAQGNMQLLEYWKEIISLHAAYKIRKWKDKFQRGEE